MTRRETAKAIGLWVATGFLVVLFALQGSAKFSSTHRWASDFANWGYPAWFRALVGIFETGAAALLLIPRVAGYGAGIIIIVMLGGMLTHVTHGDPAGMVREVVPLVLASVVVLFRRPAFLKRLRMRRGRGAETRGAA